MTCEFYPFEEIDGVKKYKNHSLSIFPLAKKISKLKEINEENLMHIICDNYII